MNKYATFGRSSNNITLTATAPTILRTAVVKPAHRISHRPSIIPFTSVFNNLLEKTAQTATKLVDDHKRRSSFRRASTQSNLPLSLIILYHDVHQWANTAEIDASQAWTLPKDLDGHETAFMLNVGLNTDKLRFEMVYVVHSRTILLRRTAFKALCKPVKVVGETKIVT